MDCKILVAPQVTLIVKQYNSKKVSIVGAVQKPGSLPWSEGMKLVDAILGIGRPHGSRRRRPRARHADRRFAHRDRHRERRRHHRRQDVRRPAAGGRHDQGRPAHLLTAGRWAARAGRSFVPKAVLSTSDSRRRARSVRHFPAGP